MSLTTMDKAIIGAGLAYVFITDLFSKAPESRELSELEELTERVREAVTNPANFQEISPLKDRVKALAIHSPDDAGAAALLLSDLVRAERGEKLSFF